MEEIYYAFQAIFTVIKIAVLFGACYIGYILFDIIGDKMNK